MAYSRPPVQPGRALTRTPAIPVETTAGVFDFALDADIATTTSLGVVQVGSGLSITPTGVLSATGGSSDLISVVLVNANYTALATDYYIGVTSNNKTITLPAGVVGKVYIVKMQVSGNITVQGTGGQKIDSATSISLGTNDSIVVVFDGTRWNVIE